MKEIDKSKSDFVGIEVPKDVANLPEDEMAGVLAKLFVKALQDAGYKFKDSNEDEGVNRNDE